MNEEATARIVLGLVTQAGGVPAPVVNLAEKFVRAIQTGGDLGAALRQVLPALLKTYFPGLGFVASIGIGIAALRGRLKKMARALERASAAWQEQGRWLHTTMLVLSDVTKAEGGKIVQGWEWLRRKVTVPLDGQLPDGLCVLGMNETKIYLGFGIRASVMIPTMRQCRAA